jgi:hypothetical protein
MCRSIFLHSQLTFDGVVNKGLREFPVKLHEKVAAGRLQPFAYQRNPYWSEHNVEVFQEKMG